MHETRRVRTRTLLSLCITSVEAPMREDELEFTLQLWLICLYRGVQSGRSKLGHSHCATISRAERPSCCQGGLGGASLTIGVQYD